ncbi:hypothetical protein J4Q44_G00235450 [Coregonus suidteri]|uniref:Uncharacterized protein n=1 Tax=Coregonus suidteri TaxID=861788 RepID=A0AAN8QKQ7_9TELE
MKRLTIWISPRTVRLSRAGASLLYGTFLVRRLSCRTVQLPPLAFRQAEQYYCNHKPEPDTVTIPPRPTTLPLRTPPLIAITSADTSR